MTTKRPTLFPLPIIGWREELRLPEIGQATIIAKIDTGARTAALHADDITIDAKNVRFSIDGNQVTLNLVGTKKIKSSSGHSELRAVVHMNLEIGDHRFMAEVTLTDRAEMGVRMLLGRNTIKGRFLVNPSRSFLISRKKKQK